MAKSQGQTADFLPLTPAVFHILLALSDSDRHGYGISKEVAATTAGTVRLGPGTLYGTLTRLLAAKLVDEIQRSDTRSAATDPRRRYYRLTPLGRAVARAEARRLADLVSVARAKSMLPGRR
jgi:DNA-binding PadR family transcriptional regulator